MNLQQSASPIYVEVSPLLTKHLTGIARFAARLIEALAPLSPLRLINTSEGDFDGNLICPSPLRTGEEIVVERGALEEADKDLARWARRLFRRPRCRHDAKAAGRSAVVYTMLRPAERHFRRELGVIYDFTPLLMPWAHVAETRAQFGIHFGQSARLSDKLLAISQSTRADASWLCALPPEDVVLAYPGPAMCVHGHAFPEPVPRGNKGILVVCTLEPRKNGRFLLDWFLQTEAIPPEMELWWVGPSGWMWEGAKRWRRRSSRGSVVRLLGEISDARLCRLYRQAAFAVYPSLYEGFGFPVLDALRHGTPVLCSFNSSLQEFAGPGVVFFEACDPGTLDAACRELFALKKREPSADVVREDLGRRFSWDALARTVRSLCA
jgi:glycosyltransferase involved in cell wall biosynthesis